MNFMYYSCHFVIIVTLLCIIFSIQCQPRSTALYLVKNSIVTLQWHLLKGIYLEVSKLVLFKAYFVIVDTTFFRIINFRIMKI